MKKIFAIIYLFGCIFIPLGLVWVGYLLAPSEFFLNKDALPTDQDALKNSKILFPNFKSKDSFYYPGALMGLTGKEEDNKFWFLICKDQGQAKSVFKNYAKKVTEGVGIHQSSGPKYHKYKNPKTGILGHIKWIDRVVVHIEGREEEKINQLFKNSGMLTPNPKANLLTEIFRSGRIIDKYLWHILIFILIYCGLQFPIWNWVTAWATTIHPEKGIVPVEESELRRRLLALNDLDVPFQISERKNGKIDATWRLADAKWAGLMTANKITEVRIIRLTLSDKEKVCRAVDITKSVKATADGLSFAFSFNSFFSRGVTFWEWTYRKQYGWIFKDGNLTFDTVYEYKFSYDEIKDPIVNIVVQSGWQYKQVLF